MTEFWKSSYWDRRFKQENEFEWLIGGDVFIEQTASWIDDSHAKAIAHIGCGNSRLSKSIHNINSAAQIYNIDYSLEAINRARQLNGEDHQIYHTADLLDARQLEKILPPVDIVVDKCCADSMSTGADVMVEDTWTISTTTDSPGTLHSPVYALALNLARVVRCGGWWLLCSYSPFRFEVLAECPAWRIEKRWSIRAQDATSSDGDGRAVHRPEVHHHFIALRRV
ncbi:hypothetical protein E3P86_03649 [Wallemia ichthyophaga]|uniref:Methyltransferase domain-containing protein n=1 Tax=Wallemia ichthyophaga TaxID=245174 RepID=A0A4T0IK99_WALIC|nr:hypothetical protein E3P86_03649 [Wallemia ichthyophaga]